MEIIVSIIVLVLFDFNILIDSSDYFCPFGDIVKVHLVVLCRGVEEVGGDSLLSMHSRTGQTLNSTVARY